MTDSIPLLSPTQVREWFSSLPKQDFASQKILVIIPAVTRPGPFPLIFDQLFHEVRPLSFAFDVLVALGTESPMSDAQISRILGIDETERGRLFFQTQLFNHEWDRPDRLDTIGTFKSEKTVELTRGSLASEIPVQINSRTRYYDLLLVISPVNPECFARHSGGNACFFPGLGGPEIVNAIAMLGEIVSHDATPGAKEIPIRSIADAAAAMLPQKRRAIIFVAGSDGSLCGLFYDTPESAWNAAAALPAQKLPPPSL